MEAVILVGLQGAGKTTFYHQRFAATHLRLSLDELRTRHREEAVLRRAIENARDVVIDNTNASIAERQRYIRLLKPAGYRIIGYYFLPDIRGCLERNALRTGPARIPVPGLFGTRKRLQPPSLSEGFDALYSVELTASRGFEVKDLETPTAADQQSDLQ